MFIFFSSGWFSIKGLTPLLMWSSRIGIEDAEQPTININIKNTIGIFIVIYLILTYYILSIYTIKK